MPNSPQALALRVRTSWLRLPAERPGLVAALLGLAVICAGVQAQFRIADDGLLWYGAQRTLGGDIPLRDFWSYDPFRYYWCAAGMALLHDQGYVVLGIVTALFGALSLWIAARLVFRDGATASWWVFLPVIATFILWMVPRAKLFDIGASVMLVAALTGMLQAPTRQRCFLAGLVLGLVTIIGRNHGLYGACADLAGLVFVCWVERSGRFGTSLLYWALGGLLAYSPMLLAMALVPGFWAHFWASIQVYFELGTTNAVIPIPWPWKLPHHAMSGMKLLRRELLGMSLLALPLFGVLITGYCVWAVRRRRTTIDPRLVSAALLSIPYTHHAFAHAGLGHMAQAVHPMLIGVSILIVSLPLMRAAILAALLCLFSIVLLVQEQPAYQLWRDDSLVSTAVGGDHLALPRGTVREVTAVTDMTARYLPAGSEMVAEPMLTGAYAIAQRRAAVWDVYASAPADATVQGWEINRIQEEHPGLVILAPAYRRTHPLVYRFIVQHFTPADGGSLSRQMHWDVYVPGATPVSAAKP